MTVLNHKRSTLHLIFQISDGRALFHNYIERYLYSAMNGAEISPAWVSTSCSVVKFAANIAVSQYAGDYYALPKYVWRNSMQYLAIISMYLQ